MIVEHEGGLAQSLADALSRAGYTVVPLSDARVAIELASRVSFDAAVVDLEMSDADGARALRELAMVAPSTKRFLMTGDRDEVRLAQLTPLVRRVMRKPLSPDVLLSALHEEGVVRGTAMRA